MVNNFPLSHVIFKVNFPLSNDPLALVSEKHQQQRHNTGLSLKSPRLSSFIEFISHVLLRIFHSSWLFNAQIFHSDTQAKLQFWDTATKRAGNHKVNMGVGPWGGVVPVPNECSDCSGCWLTHRAVAAYTN